MDPFEFARIAAGMLPREDETGSNEEPAQRGIPQKVSGVAGADSAGGYVSIDLGGSSVTEGDLQAVEMPTDIPVKAGDEVSVEIVDGKPRVVGRIGWGDELQSVADEALEVAQATGQYFWHDTNGAHVSTEALNPTGPSNSLWNSLGLLIRKAANNLVSITQSAIAFYDGNGNDATNVLASFGSTGAQIGKSSTTNVAISSTGMDVVSSAGTTLARFDAGHAIIGEYQNQNVWHGVEITNDGIAVGFDASANPSQTSAASGYSIAAGEFGEITTTTTPLKVTSSAENSSIAVGLGAVATGAASSAFGNLVNAKSDAQHVIGMANVPDAAGTYIEIVGNGTSRAQSNARTLDWNGNEVLAGGLTLGSPLTVANGGTGADNAADARANLGLGVTTSSPTLTNATATAFELRKSGSVVNLQIQQLKVGASLADGSTVSLGSGIIPSGSRPAHAIGFPLVANVAGKGAGCWLYITAAGNVTLYNRSGSALGTNTNLYGNTTWVV